MIPVSHLVAGEFATITAVDAGADNASALLVHGFVPGTRVELVRRAPLGDPLILRLRGIEVAIRISDAASVSVRRC